MDDSPAGARTHGYRDAIGLGRILAFTDGVFAIAITLLVFTLHVPSPESPRFSNAPGSLEKVLHELSPRFGSFFLSFTIIGMFWVSHHRKFRVVKRYDDMLLWLNLLFLMPVVAIPFVAELIGEYNEDRLAAVTYGCVMTMAGLTSALLWWYLSSNHRLIDERLSRTYIRRGMLYCLIPAALFAFATVVAVFDEDVAMVLWYLPLASLLLLEFHRHRTVARDPTLHDAVEADVKAETTE